MPRGTLQIAEGMGNFKLSTNVFPELKRQTLEIRELEAAESCRTKFWRGELHRKRAPKICIESISLC